MHNNNDALIDKHIEALADMHLNNYNFNANENQHHDYNAFMDGNDHNDTVEQDVNEDTNDAQGES